MFTGIIEATGQVLELKVGWDRAVLGIKTPLALRAERVGNSIAVNGCCLTMTQKGPHHFTADLSLETLRVTNLGRLKRGQKVNLERPLRLSDRLGGHLVQGHVDAVGRVLAVESLKEGSRIRIGFPSALKSLIISKGSIAVDGVSMTVNALTRKDFTLVVIPHTLAQTTLGEYHKGDLVNLEADMIGKYVKGFL